MTEYSLGSSYPVSLLSLLEEDPAARELFYAQSESLRLRMLASNLRTKKEVEEFIVAAERNSTGK